MSKATLAATAVVAALLAAGGLSGAQGPTGQIAEAVALDNESVRIVVLTYQPGADSGIHLNPGPEVTIVQEGELTLYTPAGKQVLGPGAARWLEGFKAHLARNEGAVPVKFWSLLIKRCE